MDSHPGPADDHEAAEAHRSAGRTAPRFAPPTVLRANPVFARLWGASFISGIGSLTTFIALPLVAYERTGSAATFATIMAATTAGTLLMSLIGGAFADRGDRRQLLLAGDVLLIIELVAMGVAVHLGAWGACAAIAFLTAATTATFRAASPALQRDLVPEGQRVAANALTQFMYSTTSFFGPLLGAAMYPVLGFSWIVAFDVLTFAASFLLLLGVRDPMRDVRRTARAAPSIGDAVAQVLGDVRAGMRVGVRDPFIRPELLAAMLSGVGNGMFIVAIVPWLVDGLGLPASSFGVVIAVVGISGIVASIIVSRIADRIAPQRLMLLGAGAGVIGSIGFFFTPPLWLLAVSLLAFGVANVVSSIGSSTLTQKRFPSALQGRLASLHGLGFQGCNLMGVLIAGTIAGAVGVQLPVTLFAVLILAAQVAFVVALVGSRRPVSAEVASLLVEERAAVESPAAALSDTELAVSG